MRDRVLAARQNTAYLEADDVGLPEDTESFRIANPLWPGLFLGAWAWERMGGGVPAAHNSKTIHGIEMKFGTVVENHKLINLV